MTTDKDEHYRKMTEWPIPKLVISLAIPTTISMLITNIYNMADTYFVGTIDNSASGAVGVVFGIMAIIQAFGFMYGHGAGSIVARKLGAKDAEAASQYVSVSFFFAMLTGLLISIFGNIFADGLMRTLGSTETILPYARDYGRYILLAAPFMCSSCVLNNIMRYEGRAVLSMFGLVTGGVLNIGLDALFIMGMGMKTAGAGLATAISQTVSFCILLFMFLSGRTQTKISIGKFFKYAGHFGIICRTGMPSLMRQGLSSVSTMLLNRTAGFYGQDAAIAAMAIVNKICFFIFAVGLGIGQGFQPVCATNYGAKKYTRVRSSFYFTMLAGTVALGTFAIVGLFTSGTLIQFFRDDAEVVEIGTFALRCQLVALFFVPVTVCTNMLFQSIGKNASAIFVSMLRSGLCFIPALLILSRIMGLTGVEMAQAVGDVLSFVISAPFALNFVRKLSKEDGNVNS